MKSEREILQERIREILRASGQEMPNCCLLCAAKPIVVLGIFFPSEDFARRWGVPANKSRNAVYALCGTCSELSDAEARVEQVILSGTVARNN